MSAQKKTNSICVVITKYVDYFSKYIDIQLYVAEDEAIFFPMVYARGTEI